jgi:hypothetical protein
MIWRSVWHIESTGILARIAIAVAAAILGSLGICIHSPILSTLAGLFVFLFLLIYRLRYKRL